MTPKEFDNQNKINIIRWIDLDSEECKLLDDNMEFTKKCIKFGFQDVPGEPAFMTLDSLGRIWCSNKDGSFGPFHFEYGGQKLGYRISKKASN